MNQSDRGKVAASCGFAELTPDCHSPVPEGLAQARTVHGGYGAEMPHFRELVREMREDARRPKVGRF